MIGGAGSRHRRRRSSPGVHFAQAQQVARLAALNQRDGDGEPGEPEFNQALARRRSSEYSFLDRLTDLPIYQQVDSARHLRLPCGRPARVTISLWWPTRNDDDDDGSFVPSRLAWHQRQRSCPQTATALPNEWRS